MTYEVLARKWRPRIFSEMAGQNDALQALVNALDQNRLHHAYLFSGTRGVGKTSIARILAKSINCEQGVSSIPCGKCNACVSIAEGRFLDLIEVDAASKTKVDDTRELLENVQYSPSIGRYKVYLIDEVHMLSKHSFNALLKTLEEPPAHVKFLLATTDPQKLPVTVLSRCLQFNLKNISPEVIVEHLKHILDKEEIKFEESGLWFLAKAANGSMRDALSLTDQAISYCPSELKKIDICNMLGSVDRTIVNDLAVGLIDHDGAAVMSAINKFSEFSPDYSNVLSDLLSLFHKVAIAQTIPEAITNSEGDKEFILDIAKKIPAEDTQLFYQTALLGRRDLGLAPEPRIGFEMILLRMLAFYPDHSDSAERPKNLENKTKIDNNSNIKLKLANKEEKTIDVFKSPPSSGSPVKKEKTITNTKKVALKNASAENWYEIYSALRVNGVLKNISSNLTLFDKEGVNLLFVLDETESAFYDASHDKKLSDELSAYFGTTIVAKIEVGAVSSETPKKRLLRLQEERNAEATENLNSDPNINEIKTIFDGVLLKNTIKSID
ncbi:MAG: DNA polymerase III subunit gamma/tau [Porticoccus sp.]|jgi:DNA polymerase-3 subunit gamma/tau|nr:DNA polymerase III subunit gamma/tau [Porticoccus sp.]